MLRWAGVGKTRSSGGLNRAAVMVKEGKLRYS